MNISYIVLFQHMRASFRMERYNLPENILTALLFSIFITCLKTVLRGVCHLFWLLETAGNKCFLDIGM